MSYIVAVENRYIGEHKCSQDHYGDQSTIRDGCILTAFYANENANKVAFTRSHPAVAMLEAAVNHLTTAELEILKGMVEKPWFPGNAGFDIFGHWQKWEG